MNLRDQLVRFLSPLSNRIRMMLARGVISTVNDGTKVQQMSIKLLAGEMRDKVERFQEYGFTSHPHDDMEVLTVFIGGDRANPVIVAVGDRKFRLKDLKKGEVALYTDEGDTLIFKRGRTLEINTSNYNVNAGNKTEKITDGLTVNVGGNVKLTAGGNLTAEVAGDSKIKSTGKISVTATGVDIDGAAGGGANGMVVTTLCVCPITGAPHIQGSATVKASI